MLSSIGERTQSSLDIGHPSIAQAVAILDGENLDFQNRGWWFNIETDLVLARTDDGRVPVPADTLEFRLTAAVLQYLPPEQKTRYVKRGEFVYDNLAHTFMIDRPLRADITRLVNVEDMPGAAFSYLRNLAAQTMYMEDDGDQAKMQRLEERTARSWQQLQAAHLKATAPNRLDSPVAQQLRYRMGHSGFGLARAMGRTHY
jgi:hypothetical protein